MKENLSKYGFLRLAVISPEMRIADIDFNLDKIISAISDATRKHCQIILFPELSITGYSCADLFFQSKLLRNAREAINQLASKTRTKKIVIVIGAPIAVKGKLFNCAVVLNSGNILGIVPKTELCNTGEYYEERWFSSEIDRQTDYIKWDGNHIPFGADLVFEQNEVPFANFGIEICEDLWAIKSPSNDLSVSGAQIILNLSASNEYLTKQEYRKNLVNMQSARCLSAYAMASSGPNESSTDTVFSGHSIVAENGIILDETDRFHFDTQMSITDIDVEKLNNERQRNNSFGRITTDKNFRTVNFSLNHLSDFKIYREIHKSPFVPNNINLRKSVCEEIFSIQTTGLIQRLRHTGCKSLIIGISGGLDSTLALLVAIESFKKLKYNLKNIISVTLPGHGTSSRTKSNAEKLAKLLGVNFKLISITNAVEQHLIDINHKGKKDIVFENAQARERTQILMDLANKLNGLLVGTGDLSEIALGWSTYNADHISMYNVNSGIPKTLVQYIIKWVSEEKFTGKISKVLNDICDTPISPELLPTDKSGKILQKTEELIGPFQLHDFFMYYAIRMNYSPKKILFLALIAFRDGYSKNEILKWLKVFYKRFFDNQFKRSCMPDGVKVGTLALSPRADWRMPSDAKYKIWLKELNDIK